MEDCSYVTRENCQNQKQTKCEEVPYKDCQTVHKLVPKQVEKTKAFKVNNQTLSIVVPLQFRIHSNTTFLKNRFVRMVLGLKLWINLYLVSIQGILQIQT